MNFSTAIFLVNDQARALRCIYETDNGTYINQAGDKVKSPIFKTLDRTIKKDDLVVVPTGTRHGFTVVKVSEVDIAIDFEDKTPVEWIVARLDLAPHKAMVEQEFSLIEKIKVAEFQVRRNQLANALDLSGQLTSLPLASQPQKE